MNDNNEEKKLDLNVWDRLNIPKLLPSKANYVDSIIILDLKQKINLTQEEIKEYNVIPIDDQLKWNEKGTEFKEFMLTDLEIKLLQKGVDDLGKKSEISTNIDFIKLCKKIKEL